MLAGCFPGTLGLVTPNGWMDQELFVKVLEHVIEYSNCTKDNPILLIFDHHESHLFIQAVDMAKNNETDLLSSKATKRPNPKLCNILDQFDLASSSNQQSSTPSTLNIISPTRGTPAKKQILRHHPS
ncbi:hypothetical protein ILUMI_20028 [Ignelater luminosus]|uniref:DDE-1 domain-containing protein n=1 Tax=Ignelater luminosus TaxID=2038154 RepID=A0A8K0CF19_IGNLU|nr:hypothetical protein ILUMI_20028 [Ignelater luminosus]